MIPLAPEGDINCLNGNFLCGVVEGFYGRPWTTEQRKVLFKRMKKLGLNTYLYAPKDDSKHRMYWRDLYSVEEADHLTSLIEAAEENNVSFIYALSPGLDMTYSNTKEVTFLKRKLEQVGSFGCKYFALLFDDIETDMCEGDKEIFQTIAHAQVSVTNEVYQHLNQPRFLFCPTEYCGSRALPSVSQSEYLKTLGSKLLPGIDIMWTGCRVIPKLITVKDIEEITEVLQRPPIIWDNIHANDYDPKRLFLGPYDGRSPDLIPYLRGVMTNPNCEFEANFVAIHTLSQWKKSDIASIKRDITTETVVNADIRLETDGEFSSQDDCPHPLHSCYQPKQALSIAITDWLEELMVENSPPTAKILAAPAPVMIPTNVTTCTAITPTTSTQTGIPGLAPVAPIKNLNEVEISESYMQPVMNPVNSLVDPLSSSDSETESLEELEPMDCAITPGSSPVIAQIHIPNPELPKAGSSGCLDCMHKVESSSDMLIDSETSECLDCAKNKALTPSDALLQTNPAEDNLPTSLRSSCVMSHEDMQLLVDMFYLPFDHGSNAVDMLNDFHWLKANCYVLKTSKCKTATETELEAASLWHQRAEDFRQSISQVCQMFDRLCTVPNKTLVYELFPYIFDLKGVLLVVDTFVQWLACGLLPVSQLCHLIGSPLTWANTLYREGFTSGDHEPWVYRGGLQAEFQRMLPLDGASDLMTPMFPVEPAPAMCAVRPYCAQDEEAVYEVCRKTCDDGLDGTEIFPEQPDLIGDKLIGAFLTNSPGHCFVIEDGTRICGYVLAAPEAKDFAHKMDIAWLPAMQEKYPKPEKMDGLSPAEEMICGFHSDRLATPSDVYARFPSLLRMDILKDKYFEPNAPRWAMASAISALKANGSHGVHVEVAIGDKNTHDFYTKLGFLDVPLCGSQEDVVIMGRAI